MAPPGQRPTRQTSHRHAANSSHTAARNGESLAPQRLPSSRKRIALLILSSVLLLAWISYLAVLAFTAR